MLHKLILQNWRFNLCTGKQSFKYSQTLIIPIQVCAQANVHAICTRICIRNQTNTLRFSLEDNPLYIFTLWLDAQAIYGLIRKRAEYGNLRN